MEPISGPALLVWLMITDSSLSLRAGRDLTDLRPALDGVGASQGLEQHHPGLRGMELISAAHGQEGHVPATRADHAHLAAGRRAGKPNGPCGPCGHRGLVEFQEPDLDLAVHHQREFVLGGGAPAGGALRADSLDHVLDVLADRDLLVRLGSGRHLEDVREDVVARIVVDDLDAALVVVLKRTETRAVLHRSPPYALAGFEFELFVFSGRRLVTAPGITRHASRPGWPPRRDRCWRACRNRGR